jgi:multidrug efflux pump subunit AcrB
MSLVEYVSEPIPVDTRRGPASTLSSVDATFWLSRISKSIIFFLLVLTAEGAYAAFQVPISVFPETNFPRILIGIQNGVMPVEQMQVTITKPIEDAVNSVPGLKTVRFITSR